MQKKELRVDEFRDSTSSKELQQLKFLLQKYFKGYDLSYFEKVFEKSIPVSIFRKSISPLETVVKYLKENLQYKNKDIATVLGKSTQSIWQAYRNAAKKSPKPFDEKFSPYFIPMTHLKTNGFTLNELIVSYLLETFSLSYHQVAVLLKRDDRTIWTVYQRYKKKKNEKKRE